MLYTIALILIVLWLLGVVTSYSMGGLIPIPVRGGDRSGPYQDPQGRRIL